MSHWKGSTVIVVVVVEESRQPRLCFVHDVRKGDRSEVRGRISAELTMADTAAVDVLGVFQF